MPKTPSELRAAKLERWVHSLFESLPRIETTPPAPMEVRGSVSKQIILMILAALFVALLGFISIGVFFFASDHPFERNDEPGVMRWLFLVSFPIVLAGAVLGSYRNCQILWPRKIFLQLTPEGLIVPCLGSTKPIPWDKVVYADKFYPGGGLWPAPGISLCLTIDPSVRTKGPRPSPFVSWVAGRKDLLTLKFPAIFNVRAHNIRRVIEHYQAWTRYKNAPTDR